MTTSNPIFSCSAGRIEARLALPQRSPYPLTVPWTRRAPAATAASELATAHSASLWVWMPTSTPSPSSATTAAVAAPTNSGRLPPLVSQRVTFSAPASAAARAHLIA